MEIKKEKKPKKGFMDVYKTYDTSNGFGSASEWQNAFDFKFHFKILNSEEKIQHQDIVQSLRDSKDADTLKKNYYQLMLKYHPDKAGDTVENKTIAQHINDTYFKLKKKF